LVSRVSRVGRVGKEILTKFEKSNSHNTKQNLAKIKYNQTNITSLQHQNTTNIKIKTTQPPTPTPHTKPQYHQPPTATPHTTTNKIPQTESKTHKHQQNYKTITDLQTKPTGWLEVREI
jgi:hypothetical protein